MTDFLLTYAAQLDAEPEHVGRIEERESVTMDRLCYRPRCACGWFGWAVMDRDNGQRQIDQHVARFGICR